MKLKVVARCLVPFPRCFGGVLIKDVGEKSLVRLKDKKTELATTYFKRSVLILPIKKSGVKFYHFFISNALDAAEVCASCLL